MPRANTDAIARAFARRERATGNNTICDGDAVILHGGCIAWWAPDGVPWVGICGWPTNVTEDRVNAIIRALGGSAFYHHRTRKGIVTAFYGGVEVGHAHCAPVCGPLGALLYQAEQREREREREHERAPSQPTAHA